MADLDVLTNTVQQAMELSLQGRKDEALVILDASIVTAIRESRTVRIAVLCCNAAAIAESAGYFERAEQYIRRGLALDPDNPLGLYTMANVLARQDRTVEAHEFAIKSYRSCLLQGGADSRSLMELILLRWPGIEQT